MTPKVESKSILDNPIVAQERAIIYARVSSTKQAEEGTSLDKQVEASLNYAKAHNLHVPSEFVFEEDFSGAELDRPKLNEVRKLLREGRADNLIIYKVDRQDRSWAGVNYLLFLKELKEFGVSFHKSEANREVNLNDDTQILLEGIEGWYAGKDRQDTVKKLHKGRIDRARGANGEKGHVVPNGGKAPYGYRPVKVDKRWYFEIVEDEARIIRLIFHWYVFGDETRRPLNLANIADKLNQMGIPASKGGKWRRAGVQFIVSNETYCGVWRYGKRQGRKKYRPASESIPVEVPPIVGRDVWEAAQERLKHNKDFAQRNRKPGRYLLSNRVVCGVCGYRMFGVTKQVRGTAYSYYACRNRHLTQREKLCECDNTSYHSQVVDARVWDKLEEVSKDKDKLIAGLRNYQARQESKVEPIRRELAYVEELIKDKTAEWEDEYLNLKVLTSERAKAKKAADIAHVEAVLDGLEKRKVDLLAQLEERSLTDEQIIGLAAFGLQVAEDMATLREAEARGQDTPELRAAVYEEKRRLLAVLDLQVTLFVADGRKKARIVAKYCPDGDVLSVESGSICTPRLGKRSARRNLQNRPTYPFHTQQW